MTGRKVVGGKTKKIEELVELYYEAFTSSGRVHRAHKEYYKFNSDEHYEALLEAVKRLEKKGGIKPDRFIIASEIYFYREKGSEEWKFYDDLNEDWWFDSTDYEDYDELTLSEFIKKHKKEIIEAFKNAIDSAKITENTMKSDEGYEYDVRAGIIIDL